jgi:hypothetical protein
MLDKYNAKINISILHTRNVRYVPSNSRKQQDLHNFSLYQGGQVQVPSHLRLLLIDGCLVEKTTTFIYKIKPS